MDLEPKGIKLRKRKAKISPRQKALAETNRKIINKAKKIRRAKRDKMQFSEESDDGERSRTPSGMELSGKVQGIRTFFSPVNKMSNGESSDLPRRECAVSHENHSSKESATTEAADCDGGGASNSTMFSDKNNNNNKLSAGNDDESEFLFTLAKHLKPIADERSKYEKHSQSQEDIGDNQTNNNLEPNHINRDEAKVQVRKSDSTAIKRMVSSTEENEEDNPKAIAIASVIQALGSFKKDITQEIKNESTKLREDIKIDLQKWKDQSVQDFRKDISDEIEENPKFKQMEAEVAYWKIKAETLTEVCDRMNTEMGDLSARLSSIEINGAKKKAIITGVKLRNTSDKVSCIQAIDSFLTKTLKTSVHIDDFFMIGEGDVRPIVLIFPSLEAKRVVMANKTNLKNVRVDGRKVFLNDYLPPAALEDRKRNQDIISALYNSNQSDKLSYIKGAIAIDGKVYKKPIVPPTPKELVDISPEEISRILKIKTNRGDEFIKQNSSFIGYCANVGNHEEIADLYKKLKLIKPSARHIVCAFVLDMEGISASDFHDDGEPGAGRAVLDMMERKQMTGKVVFIARKYGGIKMGSDRFVCYLKAAKSCLGLDPDEPENPAAEKTSTRYTSTRNKASRGGNTYGRGRGRKNYGAAEDKGSPQAINFTTDSVQQPLPYAPQRSYAQQAERSAL